MGGNAIKKLIGKIGARLNKTDYEKVVKMVFKKLKPFMPRNAEGYVIKGYENKKDYGDLDLLLFMPAYELRVTDMRDLIRKAFKAECVVNDNCYSFPVKKDFQVDIMVYEDKYRDTALAYLQNGELGNFMGRIYHKMGLKFGQHGLILPIRKKMLDGTIDEAQDQILDEMIICTNIQEILELGGFDVEKFDEGFKSLQEVFDFMVKCEYFDPTIFKFENLNHINRTRNRKRTDYKKFVEWLETQDFGSRIFKNANKYTVEELAAKFPPARIQERMNVIRARFEIQKEMQAKFNGTLVSLWTGLTGEELGKFIAGFKKTKRNFEGFVINQAENKIEQSVKEYLTLIQTAV